MSIDSGISKISKPYKPKNITLITSLDIRIPHKERASLLMRKGLLPRIDSWQ